MNSKALKLLEEEGLTIWKDLGTEQKDNCETAKETLTSKLTPASFVTLDTFHRQKLLPGETLPMHHLKKLLLQAILDLDTIWRRDQLLLH